MNGQTFKLIIRIFIIGLYKDTMNYMVNFVCYFNKKFIFPFRGGKKKPDQLLSPNNLLDDAHPFMNPCIKNSD